MSLRYPARYQPQALPPLATAIFNGLSGAGLVYAALHGGALRDCEAGAIQKRDIPVNDYDVRVWLPFCEFYDKPCRTKTLERIEEAFNSTAVSSVRNRNPDKIRYILAWADTVIDLCLQPVPAAYDKRRITMGAVAQHMAQTSGLGLNAISIDTLGWGWATEQYRRDMAAEKITVYMGRHAQRRVEHATRIQQKYPRHTIVAAWSNRVLALPGSPPPDDKPKPAIMPVIREGKQKPDNPKVARLVFSPV